MSIASMSRLAVEAAEQRKTPTTPATAEHRARTGPQGASMLTAIADWMPSEAVAFYLGAIGLFPPNNDPSKDMVQRWVVFAAGSAVVLLLVTLNVLVRVRLNKELPWRSARRELMVLALLSWITFAVWAGAGPGNPLKPWWDDAEKAFLLVAGTLLAVMPTIATLCGVTPQDIKLNGDGGAR